MEKILEVCNLRKCFQRKKEITTVLNDISFCVKKGEFVGLVGKSGCGKSTLARIITRLVDADDGSVKLLGWRDILKLSGKNLQQVYADVQLIFQHPREAFNPRKTLGWSISEILVNRNFTKTEADERLDHLLKQVGLSQSFAARYPHEVSGGECQRAAIARAIALSPALLVCDEATSALDVTVQAQIMDLIKSLCRKSAIACLFISHDLALLQQYCDRLIVMHDGKIVEEGKTEQVIKQPQSQYTRELMCADFFNLM
ncbi:MAG: transporter [Firmicutes bacterium]|nr:transporter [Bacillota bacterium]